MTRQALIEAALLCFAKYGYEAASIRLVASMAGCNVSLIAYHFGSKEGLYREVIQHLLTVFPIIQPDPWPDPSPGETPEQLGRTRLRAFILEVLTSLDTSLTALHPDRSAVLRLWVSELTFPRPEVKDLLERHLASAVGELGAVIRTLRPDFTPAQVAFWGISIQGCCLAHTVTGEINRLVWPEPSPPYTLEEMADYFTDFIVTGLTGRPSPRPTPLLATQTS